MADRDMLLPSFQLERVLNQDQGGRRVCLAGTIDNQPALITLERAPFASTPAPLARTLHTLTALQRLGANDIYFWYLASSGATSVSDTTDATIPPDVKINLIYPCTEQHIKKYSRQGVRTVIETPRIYFESVMPYMRQKREEGRLNWVWNIIEGKTEVADVIFRTPLGQNEKEGFLLLPDLNWDRKTLESLHLLGIVERRDIWSLRDLKKKHTTWLRVMKEKLIQATVEAYPDLEADQLKTYVHYQPTYYHFHVHVVHIMLEASATQAVGKAIGLDSIIEQLEHMRGDEEQGMEKMALSYTLGEASELWRDVFEPLKESKTKDIASPPH